MTLQRKDTHCICTERMAADGAFITALVDAQCVFLLYIRLQTSQLAFTFIAKRVGYLGEVKFEIFDTCWVVHSCILLECFHLFK